MLPYDLMSKTSKTKPALSYTIMCDDVRQELGGKFSLMGLFESISAHTFPAFHARFAIVNEWRGGRGDFAAKIRLLAPDQRTVLSESASRFSLFNEAQRHRDISIRLNSTFSVPGTYWIEMLLDDEQIALIPLPIHLVNQQNIH